MRTRLAGSLFAVLVGAGIAASCSGSSASNGDASGSGGRSATWTWSFAGGSCPPLVTTVHISVTITQSMAGDCRIGTMSLADVSVPCSDGSAALQFRKADPAYCSPPAVLTLDALTDDGGIYARDTRTSYDESDGHSDLPSGLGMVKLVWTLESGSGSAVACPPTAPPAYVQTSLGGQLACGNGSGYVAGQPGTYDLQVMLIDSHHAQIGAGSAMVTLAADQITTTPVVITVP